MMRVLRSRRLAGLAGCAALVSGVAGTAGAVPAQAQARATATVSQSQVVASWGRNDTGQLGDGTTTRRALFGDIGAGTNVVQVDDRYEHGLAVESDGTVRAWGYNALGELG